MNILRHAVEHFLHTVRRWRASAAKGGSQVAANGATKAVRDRRTSGRAPRAGSWRNATIRTTLPAGPSTAQAAQGAPLEAAYRKPRVSASAGAAGQVCRRTHSAHSEGLDGDERPASSRRDRHRRGDGDAHRARDCRGDPRPDAVGSAPRPPLQGERRDDPGRAGRQLSGRARLRAHPGAGALRQIPRGYRAV